MVLQLECFRKEIDQKYPERLKCCQEKTNRTSHVKNDEVLHRVKEEINVLHTIKERKAN
jgi:hypothetical protein